MNKFVLTGGPGVGKSSLIEALRKKGYPTIGEAARQVILKEQEKQQHDPVYRAILPWTQLEQFQELCLATQLDLERKVTSTSSTPTFLDRSCVDPLAYIEMGQVKIPAQIYTFIEQAAYSKIFFLERLPSYIQDSQRLEDEDYANRLHDKLYEVYNRLGFDIVTVPVFAPEQHENIDKRIEFILQHTTYSPFHEIERKYRVPHAYVQRAMTAYQVQPQQYDYEHNQSYDVASLLKDQGILLRMREVNDRHLLTIKGPASSGQTKRKVEINIPLPKLMGLLINLFPPDSEYHKQRQTYSPFGDPHCYICFDYVPELNAEFVEIEARSENQVLLWEQRLGLATYLVKESYPELLRERRGA